MIWRKWEENLLDICREYTPEKGNTICKGLPWAQTVKNPPAMQETWVRSLGQEDPLEKGMATHSSILAGRTPWTEKPGRLQSRGSQRIVHDWSDWACTEQPALLRVAVLRLERKEAGREVMREDVPHFRPFLSVWSFYGGVLVSPTVLGRNVQFPVFFCDYESETAIWSAPLLLFPVRNTATQDLSWDSPPCLFRSLN